MTWLIIGLLVVIFYVIWFSQLLKKRDYNQNLLIVAIAHFPYLIANLVAPFRGFLDPDYLGYVFGLVRIPSGIWVAIIVGSIVAGCFFIATKALKNQMKNLWAFSFFFDLALLGSMAGPMLVDILFDPAGSSIQLGEFLTISGLWVAFIAAIFFAGPTLFAVIYSAKKIMTSSRSRTLNSK